MQNSAPKYHFLGHLQTCVYTHCSLHLDRHQITGVTALQQASWWSSIWRKDQFAANSNLILKSLCFRGPLVDANEGPFLLLQSLKKQGQRSHTDYPCHALVRDQCRYCGQWKKTGQKIRGKPALKRWSLPSFEAIFTRWNSMLFSVLESLQIRTRKPSTLDWEISYRAFIPNSTTMHLNSK